MCRSNSGYFFHVRMSFGSTAHADLFSFQDFALQEESRLREDKSLRAISFHLWRVARRTLSSSRLHSPLSAGHLHLPWAISFSFLTQLHAAHQMSTWICKMSVSQQAVGGKRALTVLQVAVLDGRALFKRIVILISQKIRGSLIDFPRKVLTENDSVFDSVNPSFS